MHQQRVETPRGDRVTVAPVGPLDLATSPSLAEALAAAQAPGVVEIVVDLTEVDFLDSAGIAALIRGSRELAKAGCPLYLCGANGSAAKVLEITNVTQDVLPPPPD